MEFRTALEVCRCGDVRNKSQLLSKGREQCVEKFKVCHLSRGDLGYGEAHALKGGGSSGRETKTKVVGMELFALDFE